MSVDWGRQEAAGRWSARREQPISDIGRKSGIRHTTKYFPSDPRAARTEQNFVLALPVHREEVLPLMAVPGSPDRIGGFDAKGRNHGVAQRDQRLLPRRWIDEFPRR